MDIKNCSYSKIYEEMSIDNTYDALKDSVESVIKPCILAYRNMSYMGLYEDETNHVAAYVFKIAGYERILLAVEVRALGQTNVRGAINLCSIDGENLKTIRTMDFSKPIEWKAVTVLNANKMEYYANYELRFVKNADGTLKTMYGISQQPSHQNITFSRDDRNDAYACVLLGSVLNIYYDGNASDDLYNTLKPTRYNCEGMVYRSKLPIIKNNIVSGLMTEPVAILNDSLGTNADVINTLIDVNGTKYRHLSYGFWVEDND